MLKATLVVPVKISIQMKYCSIFFSSSIPLVLVSLLSLCCESQAIEPIESGNRKANAEIIELPPGMQMDVFADESLVANPVAFSIDEKGRVFVCETFRQGKGVEDNRKHLVWLEDDLAAQSVADRLAMFHTYLGKKVNDFSVFEDRVRLISDTDQDKVADKVTTFADGFNEIEDGTGAGVLAINGDVYYTCIPNLWSLKDADGDGIAEVRKSLHSGYGVRVAFRGHDMHGLTLGPDGRVYFSIGDRGYNVITPEGNHLHRPYCGAVFRCERDGSGLEEFAYGLRNPQELAFDDYGNLFTGDNNSDSGDLARLVYVLPGSDSGWRMYYQYLDDRGPWNRERIWLPYQWDVKTTALQPASILPPVANLADGPSGLVAYPGTGLPARYNDHFFLADFYGTPALSGIRSFAVEKHGAGFVIRDSEWFIKGILATDVDNLLRSRVNDEGESPKVRAASLQALFDLHDSNLMGSICSLVRDDDAAVRKVARSILATSDPVAATEEAEYVLQGDSTDEKQQVIQMLCQLDTAEADRVLLGALRHQLTSDASLPIRLDLLEAAHERGESALVDVARELESQRDLKDPLANYRECLAGGNAEHGEKVFFKNKKVTCVRCHMVNERGGSVGPNLSKIGREKTAEYLLESIVLPSAKISPGYSTVQFLMGTGRVQSGVVKKEESDHFAIQNADGDLVTVQKNEIDEMQAGLSGMPADIVQQLSKRELRDLVAYLGTLVVEKKRSAHVE